jgi:DNA-binding CsgD family transcriptional regulator/PAS domain-containing protein
MNPETKVLSELIGTIYDAPLDPSLWPGVLKKLAEFVGGSAASIYCKSTTTGAVYHQFGTDPHYQQLYFSKYVRVDPTTAGHCLADIGQLVSIGDIMPYREFEDTRLHQEWASPQGLVDCLSTPLEKSATGAALFGVFRHRDHGMVDDEARRRTGLIAPHIRRAALIGNVLDTKTAETTAFMEALNGLAAGVFLVDRNGRVVFANPSGRAMLEDGRILRLKNDALASADSRPALADVIAAAGDGDTSLGVSGIAVPLSAPPQTLWLAHVLPLTSGARRQTGKNFDAVAAVFVHQTSLESPSSLESMSKLYRLTPGEMRVLSAMGEVCGISAVADVVGISEATVKTHLRRLFAKTGTKRQTALIKLAAAHASPLRQQ